MLIFSQKISDMYVCDGIASETTLATFKTGASAKEVAILKASGQAVPTTKEDVRIIGKDISGRLKYSPIIPGGAKILDVHKTSPATAVPEYNYFTPVVTGAAAGDLVEVFMKVIGGLGNKSVDNWVSETIMYTFTAGDSALNVAQGITRQAHLDLSSNYWYNNPPQVIYNNAGYTLIFDTKAAVVTGKATLTDTTLIYVIEDNTAYTVTDKTETLFDDICTEKTDWATELAAETAEYVNDIKHYSIVHTTAGITYIINNTPDTRPEIFDGEANPFYVGAMIKDASNSYAVLSEWGVTRVGEVINPTSGVKISQLEKFLDFDQRSGGDYNWQEFAFTPSAVTATDYYVVNIEFETFTNDRAISRNPVRQVVLVACSVEANADTLITALELARDGAVATTAALAALTVGDLADVTLTSAAEDEILKLNGSDVWVNAADAVV